MMQPHMIHQNTPAPPPPGLRPGGQNCGFAAEGIRVEGSVLTDGRDRARPPGAVMPPGGSREGAGVSPGIVVTSRIHLVGSGRGRAGDMLRVGDIFLDVSYHIV